MTAEQFANRMLRAAGNLPLKAYMPSSQAKILAEAAKIIEEIGKEAKE